ncbi:MAG: hypothetical protein IJ281_00310 [Clostridia bacterium]|nr:hypothetical protein [Clostridia bacterium]
MNFPNIETQTLLETKTIQIDTRLINHELHLTTVLIQVIYTDHSFYSIGIHSLNGNGIAEFRMINDVCRDKTEAEALFRILSDGEVTPCTLEYILSDLIGMR